MSRRAWKSVAAVAVIYAALLAALWEICTAQAKRKTESLLNYAVKDFSLATSGAIDTMVTHVGVEMVLRFGCPHELSIEEMQCLADLAEVDEINIVDKSGLILASNLKSGVGYDMAAHPDAAQFMVLTNGTTKVFSQPFRASTTTPDLFYKYSGIAFPGGNGYVQIGLSESRLSTMFSLILKHVFDQWLLGEKGFFLCADIRDGHIVANPSVHTDNVETLAETGFDESNMPGDTRTTFEQRLFGQKCYCRVYDFADHRIIAAVPHEEFYDARTVIFSFLTVPLLLILAGFAFFMNRIANDSDRLKKFYAAEEERRAKDMMIAKTIQKAVLPATALPSPYFSIHATMEAARDIGGDFYDYFPLGKTRIAFLIADVSGKGITAALYMMTAKTLIKGMLLSTQNPALALTRANDELCRNNPANMFLSAWVGILDLETGIISYANAGHNPPILLAKKDGAVSTTPLTQRSGPVLAFMGGVSYKNKAVNLNPGDTLFLYTDGVTEAMDKTGELFGDDRLDATLRTSNSSDPEAVCTHVRTATTIFAHGTEQTDDITMLAIHLESRIRRYLHSFSISSDAVAQAMQFLDETLDAEKCPPEIHSSFNIVVDEIVSNIVKFSQASSFELAIEPVATPHSITLVFIDNGTPYDPLSHIDPDTTLSADKRPIGGLGILMVKRLADSVSYRREHNRNFFSVSMKL